MTKRKPNPLPLGKPPLYGERLRRANITLPQAYIEAVRHHGSGVVSAGVRRLIEERWPELLQKVID